MPKLETVSSYREPLSEPFGKAAFGQYSEQEADCGPQHHLDAKRCNTEAPQNYSRDLFWHFIDLQQHILDDHNDQDDCRTGYEPRATVKGKMPHALVMFVEQVWPEALPSSRRHMPRSLPGVAGACAFSASMASGFRNAGAGMETARPIGFGRAEFTLCLGPGKAVLELHDDVRAKCELRAFSACPKRDTREADSAGDSEEAALAIKRCRAVQGRVIANLWPNGY
jgi:hypothetical protein